MKTSSYAAPIFNILTFLQIHSFLFFNIKLFQGLFARRKNISGLRETFQALI